MLRHAHSHANTPLAHDVAASQGDGVPPAVAFGRLRPHRQAEGPGGGGRPSPRTRPALTEEVIRAEWYASESCLGRQHRDSSAAPGAHQAAGAGQGYREAVSRRDARESTLKPVQTRCPRQKRAPEPPASPARRQSREARRARVRPQAVRCLNRSTLGLPRSDHGPIRLRSGSAPPCRCAAARPSDCRAAGRPPPAPSSP